MASFQNTNLQGARFDGARLDGASFCGASLIAASFQGASLKGADLTGARLSAANLAGADLTEVRGWRDIATVAHANVEGMHAAPRGDEWPDRCPFATVVIPVSHIRRRRSHRRGTERLRHSLASPPSSSSVAHTG